VPPTRGGARVAKAAAGAAAEAAQQQLPTLAENAEALEAQRDEAKQDLADTIQYRKLLDENEKQLANVRAGLSLKLKGRKAALSEADAAEQKLGRELDAELARMQLTEGLAGGGRNREKARARVNRLMREVDKCIALLGQPLAAPTTQEAE